MAFLISGGIPKSEASGGGPADFLVFRGMLRLTRTAERESKAERRHFLVTKAAVAQRVQGLVNVAAEVYPRQC